MHRYSLLLLPLISLVFASPEHIATAEDSRQEQLAAFENTIRPLLVKRCIECHGPKKAEAGLRFDSRAALLKGGDSGPAISIKQPQQSLVIKALRHADGLEMPPDSKLLEHEIVAIERWIHGGAAWPEGVTLGGSGPRLRSGPITAVEREFWSFRPIADPRPPQITDSTIRNDIDRFVLQKLRDAKLTPMPAASRQEWIRRATFDLTGLPPTPIEIQAFLKDRSARAFETVIDRLLESKAYGERWGRHWLDVVRYADTAGETADYPTPLSYKYRNWVINALNADMPYDQFVRQQIAGDILANQLVDRAGTKGSPSLDENVLRQYREMLTATGFIAISRRFGFDVENYHHLTIQDTIDVIGQSMLGLALGCARCHDHKFDPVNMTDYYAWYGIFESTRYSFPGSEQKKRPYDLFPPVPPTVLAERQQQLDQRLAALDRKINQPNADFKRVTVEIERVTGMTDFFFFGFEQATINQPPPKPYISWGNAQIAASAQSPFKNVVPGGSRGITFPGDMENNAFGRKLAAALKPRTTPELHYNIDFRNVARPRKGQGAYRFYVGHGPGNSGAIEMAANAETFLVKNGKQYEPVAKLQLGTWYNLQVTLDLQTKTFHGVIASRDTATRFEGKAFTTGWDGVIDYTFVDRYGPGGGATPAHEVDNLSINTKPFLPADKSPKNASEAADRWRNLGEKIVSQRQLRQRVNELTKQRKTMQAAGPIPLHERVYGTIDRDTSKNTRIQLRGELTRLGDEAPRRNLEILGGDTLPAKGGSGRLQLSDWLTRDANPLFARVMVNRIWQHHLGRGLVGTENDFGNRGERPSHPALLDWLASRFKESGYSMKAMHRLIMNSAAYRRSSRFDVTAAEQDPAARLLWRFNRRRLDAEEIRDAMLLVGGKLDRSTGGAHPFPAIEQWRFSQHSPFYGVYPTNRRSVYLMQQRLKRHPFLGLFDGADTNVSTARRELTTVPTQALFLMNNKFVHEQAAAFVRRLTDASGEDMTRIQLAYNIALGRPATADDQKQTETFLAAYRASAIEANVPDTTGERAAWEAFARSLMTRNEFLFVD